MSSYPESREGPSAAIAGFLASLAIFVSLIGVVYRPVRLIPAAVVVALVALAMGGRHRNLAVFAVAIAAVSWLVGMTVAIVVSHPLF